MGQINIGNVVVLNKLAGGGNISLAEKLLDKLTPSGPGIAGDIEVDFVFQKDGLAGQSGNVGS